MILKLVILIGLFAYLLVEKNYILSLLTIAGVIPYVGLLFSILLAAILIAKKYYIAASILSALIAWNLIGNYYLKKFNQGKLDMIDKKRLAKKMITGVDIIRLILYKILTEDFSNIYHEEGEEHYKHLAGAIINEIFGAHNEQSKLFMNSNNIIVAKEIENIGINHPELKGPVTDALRVFSQANFMLSGILEENFQEKFNSAIERGIFIKERDAPEPKEFLNMTKLLAEKYNLS